MWPHEMGSFRRRAAIAAAATTAKMRAPVPANATIRGAGLFGDGSGGAATCFVGAEPRSVAPASSQVRAATGSRVPAPTTLDGARAPLCAVAVIRLITWPAFSSGYLLRTTAAPPET